MAVKPNRAVITTSEDLKKARHEEVRAQLAWELGQAVQSAKASMAPEWIEVTTNAGFAHELAIDTAQLTRFLGNKVPLSKPAAKKLDSHEHVGKTSLGLTWHELRQYLDKRPPVPTVQYTVFLASPMASLPDTIAYVKERTNALKVLTTMEDEFRCRVYYAGKGIEHPEDFESPDLALQLNLQILKDCHYLVLVVMQELTRPSGVFVEAGMAIAMGIPCLLIVKDQSMLPFPLRETAHRGGGDGLIPKVRVRTAGSHAAVMKMIRADGIRLLEELD